MQNPSISKDVPVIILAHGFTSHKNTKSFTQLIKNLSDKNVATFRIDLYGHGDSGGEFEYITISEAVDDILQAINFLKKKGFSQIGLLGSSFGGIASLMAASLSHDLFCLALKAPVSNYLDKELATKSKRELDEWKKKGFKYYVRANGEKIKLNYSFFQDFANNNGYQAAPKIKIPTLIVHGDADKIVPYKQSVKTCKLIPNCHLHTISEANHRFENPEHFQEMTTALSDFLIKQAKLLQ